jgi:signal transduction histidine kinase
VYGDLVECARLNTSTDSAPINATREIPQTTVSNGQPHTSDSTPATSGVSESRNSAQVDGSESSPSENALIQRNSLSVSELAALAASSSSTPSVQHSAARTLRTELNVEAVLIIDYTNAFGGKSVRAAIGIDTAFIGAELWLPEWLSPVDINSPVKLVDTDPSQFATIAAMGDESQFRSALAVAIPGTTGAAGMVIGLANQAIDFNDSQIEKAKTVTSLLSLSASRSSVIEIAQRDESQLAAARQITRSRNVSASNSSEPKTLLGNISDQLKQFFEFDVIARRSQIDGEFTTMESLSTSSAFTAPVVNSSSEPDSIEQRTIDFSVAITNTAHSTRNLDHQAQDSVWKSVGIKSVLAIPVISSTDTVIVLGSARFAAYTPEDVAAANRFIPALTAALADGTPAPVEAISKYETVPASTAPEYVESIASATELISACGVIATQITNRIGASRVQIGFIDEETGRAHLGFDTESSDDYLDLSWINPDEIEQLTELESGTPTNQTYKRFSIARTALKVSDRTIGFVEATNDESGFTEADISKIREITTACAPVVATLKQLEQSQATLNKLEMLRRVTEQIRSNSSGDPLESPRIASLIRNLFDADWIYFGSVDHENDHSTTQITDGLDVPELAPGVRVSRRSLLIPSTLAVSSPVTIDLESAAPGQRASGRWMYRAGLRSAVCAPLRLNGVVTTMFMCASRKPTGFGSLEKRIAATIVSELEISIERANQFKATANNEKGSAQIVLEQLGPDLQSILNHASALVITIDKDGIVTDAAGRGIEMLKLVPERLLGRDFIAYSRKIEGLEDSPRQALNGTASRIEIEVFGTVLDAWMEPVISSNGKTGSATVVVSDITDRIAAARSETALNKLKEDQDRASKFIVSLSHEMKSPLTTVVALADLLSMNERGNLHPDQIERIQVVQQNADRLTLLVNDFLNISKIEAGTFKASPSKFQISELADDLGTSFEPIATGQDQKLTVTDPDDHQFATADRELLRQAIMNLLTNASKYSPPNTNVSLDIWVDENDLRITVTDEGPGIPHAERDRVFEPYSQLDNPDVPGTGMGLAIVRQIIELHHGKVWVEDGVGGGTSFAIWLPESVSST